MVGKRKEIVIEPLTVDMTHDGTYPMEEPCKKCEHREIRAIVEGFNRLLFTHMMIAEELGIIDSSSGMFIEWKNVDHKLRIWCHKRLAQRVHGMKAEKKKKEADSE
jgi:hypothetical protein